MPSDLVRFGVAIDADLLARFDAQNERKGYGNRSEAIRDLIRGGLVEETIAFGGNVAGALMIVYKHHVRELSERLTEIQHDLGDAVVSSLHVHLDHDHCLEVIVMRGQAATLKEAGDRILATRGVVHGKLTLTSIAAASAPLHAHGDGEAHAHARPASPRRKAKKR